MTQISVALSDEKMARLAEIAQQVGVTTEDLARASLESWLDTPSEDFLNAAQYVLQKNAELYRRLA